MIDDECGAVGERRIGRGNRSIRRKPAAVPLYPPQIQHVLTWARIRAAAVGSWRLTANEFNKFLKYLVSFRVKGFNSDEFKSWGLYEKRVIAANYGTIYLKTKKSKENLRGYGRSAGFPHGLC
jgi:hypothetical protein